MPTSKRVQLLFITLGIIVLSFPFSNTQLFDYTQVLAQYGYEDAENGPQNVLDEPEVILPINDPGAIGAIASGSLAFRPESGPNAGALEFLVTSGDGIGQKIINIPPGALNNLAPGTEVYPGLSEEELAALGIDVYRFDADLTLIWLGNGACRVNSSISATDTVDYEIPC